MSDRDPRRLRRPDATKNPETGLMPRERTLVDVLAAIHQECGVTSSVTAAALEHITGEPWAGSLAALTMKGYAVQTKQADDSEIGYRLTELGWALFAGVSSDAVGPSDGALL